MLSLTLLGVSCRFPAGECHADPVCLADGGGGAADPDGGWSEGSDGGADGGGAWRQQVYLKASNADAADAFGRVMALSSDGTTLAVGAYWEESSATGVNGNQADNSAPSAGAVYIFRRTGGSWAQEAYVKASNTGAGDVFGHALALSGDGNTLVVGAYGEDSNGTPSDNSFWDSGAVYVFRRQGTIWVQDAYLKASNLEPDDFFGYAVAISGDGTTLAAGALRESSAATGVNGNQTNNLVQGSGAVYVFRRTGSGWAQEAYVKAITTDVADYFGSKLVLSENGDCLAVAAVGEASGSTGVSGNPFDNSVWMAGAVYVYRRTMSQWATEAYLKASNTDVGDGFGRSLALSADGNTLAAGTWAEASRATGVNGLQTDNSARNAGAVYLFQRAAGAWAQEAYLKASNTEAEDHFGYSVALSADGTSLAVGAIGEASGATGVDGNQADNSERNSGAVYLFRRQGTWAQQAYVKASNTGESDAFGYQVSLRLDGNVLAVGAPFEDSNSVGVNGNQLNNSAAASGAAYVLGR